MPEDPDDAEMGLVDLSGLTLQDLGKLDESRVSAALRRVLETYLRDDAPDDGAIAGFSNSL